MNSYKIKYSYNTGNSFGSESGLEDFLELSWKDLNVAKANLRRIQEHYNQYKELRGYSWNDKDKTNQEILEENQDKDWFVKTLKLYAFLPENPERTLNCIDKNQINKYEKEGYKTAYRIDQSDAENLLRLYTDEGKAWQIFPTWCGYFESLNHIEIVTDNSDMKIEF